MQIELNSFHQSCVYFAFFVFQVCCALSRFARYVVWGGRNNKGRKEEKDVGSQRRKRHRPGHKTNVDNANNLDADNTRGDNGGMKETEKWEFMDARERDD